MKAKYALMLSLFLGIVSQSTSFAQSDSLGMLGDQLDLYGVLDLFKNSDNLEEFEKKLNSEDNEVNNLDLNNDDKIDYIRVIDYKEGNGHAIVLQVPINETEAQDVAVIELDHTADGEAHVQIVGDEDLYGKNYIVEPLEEKQSATVNNNTTVVVNVWAWRPVRYFYGPSYNVWVSPWRWSYYPVGWRPWRPVGWHVYHPRVVRYRPYGRVVVVRRNPRIYKTVYAPRRVTSKVVYTNRARPNYYRAADRQDNRQDNRQGRQGERQNNRQDAKPNKQQVNPTRQQRAAETKPSRGSEGKRQRVREGGGTRQHSGGGGGRGKRGK
ncbi:MAG: hypothetical protein K0R51_1986 [Cytophagaceae bacterium]|jgi:hypothetical protein|nr:hypothetical protein [Cytophagaceae bacterium]